MHDILYASTLKKLKTIVVRRKVLIVCNVGGETNQHQRNKYKQTKKKLRIRSNDLRSRGQDTNLMIELNETSNIGTVGLIEANVLLCPPTLNWKHLEVGVR